MQFEIPSHEGLPIRGDVSAPVEARALLVIAHGFKGFKDWGFFPWLAEHLCERFVVCRFNMSRSGIGENPESFDQPDLFAGDTYSTQVADLVQVTRYMQDNFRELPTFLLGHSRGGGVALLAAREIERLRGVITWSAIAHADRWDDQAKAKWRRDGFMDVVNTRTGQVMRMSPAILDDYEANRQRLDIVAAASALRVPLLVIHGGRDESVPVAEADLIASQASDVSLLKIPSASHTYNAIHPLVHVPVELSLAAEVTARFISAYD